MQKQPESIKNIFAELSGNPKGEIFEIVLQTAHVRVEKIVSHGHCSPAGFWYDQADDEWVILLKGRAGLRFNDQETVLVLKPGDYLHIPRHQRHRVEWTDPDHETIWLAFHYF